MITRIGQKVGFSTADGRPQVGITISDEVAVPTTVIDRNTGKPVEITVTRVDVVSLRESREGVKFHTISNEVVQYGYKPKMTPRFSNIVGLDATEDGEKMTLQQNLDAAQADNEAFLKGRYDARHQVVLASDL